jgi:hypothetical protein
MAENLRNFLVDQNVAINAVKRVIINYRKFPKINSPETYDNAWQMLLKKYDNKRALIYTYLQSKEKLETANELKKL